MLGVQIKDYDEFRDIFGTCRSSRGSITNKILLSFWMHRYLIDKVCNKVLLIENNKATLYNYGYKEYLEKRSNFNEETVVNKVKSVKKEKKKDNSLAIKEIESEITRLENKVNELNNELLKEEVYMDNIKSRDILNQIDSLKALLDKKISEWEDLNTL